MDYKIRWSDQSLNDFEGIVNYLIKEWSKDIADEFINNTYKRLEVLTSHPFSGVVTTRNLRYRKIVLTRQNSLFYELRKNEVIILRIFDTRQNPRKLKLRKR